MANLKNIELKAKQVEEVRDRIKRAKSIVVFDYRGLTVEEVTALRNEMRKGGVEYVVLKNGIVSRAAEAEGIDAGVAQLLKGPSAFAFSYQDVVTPARVLKDAIKKLKKCEIKGGIVEGRLESAAVIHEIADLPSREVLIARLLGSMMAPVSGLAVVLDQIVKQQTGETAAE